MINPNTPTPTKVFIEALLGLGVIGQSLAEEAIFESWARTNHFMNDEWIDEDEP